MPLYLSIALTELVTVFIIMNCAWTWAQKIRNNSVVDIFWSFNFIPIAIICFVLGDGLAERKWIACGLCALWSLRLGTHVARRVIRHLDKEEGRYAQLRKEWNGSPSRFYLFFQVQAFSNVLLSIPLIVTVINKNIALAPLEIAGAAIWAIAIIGEATADAQLSAFVRNPANKGKVCQRGLWNYSRHPNYFFQLTIWIGAFLFAVSSPLGWLSVICPLMMAYLLFNVTGIPMTEEQSLRSKGDLYREYQRTTSAFVPWFKKD